MSEFLFALLIILGVVAVPCVAFLLLALVERLFAPPALNGRELVAEGVFDGLVRCEMVSTRGLRVITYPATVIRFRGRGPHLVHDKIVTDIPVGVRVRLWRDLANDEFTLEEADQS
jgi:hypothetical protein